MKIRSLGNYDVDKVSVETGLECKDPSLAQQQFKDECDINTILERFNVTGQLPVAPLEPQYGDFSGVRDYHSALNAVIAAQQAFDELPATLRARFANDPAAFVDFCSDESNKEELIAMGLLAQEAVKAVKESPTEPQGGEAAQVST